MHWKGFKQIFFSWDLGQNRQSEVEIVTTNLHFSCTSHVIFAVLKLFKHVCLLYRFCKCKGKICTEDKAAVDSHYPQMQLGFHVNLFLKWGEFFLCFVTLSKLNIFHSSNVLCKASDTLGCLIYFCYFIFDMLSHEANEKSALAYSLVTSDRKN